MADEPKMTVEQALARVREAFRQGRIKTGAEADRLMEDYGFIKPENMQRFIERRDESRLMGPRGLASRFANRFDVATTQLAADITDVLGGDEKAQDLRELARQTERLIPDAQTGLGRTASAVGYIAPDVLTTIAGGKLLTGAAGAAAGSAALPTRVAQGARRVQQFLEPAKKSTGIIRRNLAGAAVTFPITAAGALSDNPERSATANVAAMSRAMREAGQEVPWWLPGGTAEMLDRMGKPGRLIGDVTLDVLPAAALEGAVTRAARPIRTAFDFTDDMVESGVRGMRYGEAKETVGERAARRRGEEIDVGTERMAERYDAINAEEAAREAEAQAKFARNAAEREAAQKAAEFERDLTKSAAEAFRVRLGRGAGAEIPVEPRSAVTDSQQRALEMLQRRAPATPKMTLEQTNSLRAILGLEPEVPPAAVVPPATTPAAPRGKKKGKKGKRTARSLAPFVAPAAGAAGGYASAEDEESGIAHAGLASAMFGVPGGVMRLGGRAMPSTTSLDQLLAIRNMDTRGMRALLRSGGEAAPSIGVTKPSAGRLVFGKGIVPPLTAVYRPHMLDTAPRTIATGDTWTANADQLLSNLELGITTSEREQLAKTVRGGTAKSGGSVLTGLSPDDRKDFLGLLESQTPWIDVLRTVDAEGIGGAPLRKLLRTISRQVVEVDGEFLPATLDALARKKNEIAIGDPRGSLWREYISDLSEAVGLDPALASAPAPELARVVTGGDLGSAAQVVESLGGRYFRTAQELQQGASRLRPRTTTGGIERSKQWLAVDDRAKSLAAKIVRSIDPSLTGAARTDARLSTMKEIETAIAGVVTARNNLSPDFADLSSDEFARELLEELGNSLPFPETRAISNAAKSIGEAVEGFQTRDTQYFERMDLRPIKTQEIAGVMLPEGPSGRGWEMSSSNYQDKVNAVKARAEVMRLATELEQKGIPVGRYSGEKADYPRAIAEFVERLKQSGRYQGAALTAGGLLSGAGDEEGPQQAGMNFSDLLLMGGLGYAGYRGLKRVAQVGANKASSTMLDEVLREEARRTGAISKAQASAVRDAAAAERIRRPVAPYPADPFDEMKDPEALLVNAPRIINDRAASQEVSDASAAIRQSGMAAPDGRVSWETEQEIANLLATVPDDLATRDPARRLAGNEALALVQVYQRDVNRRAFAQTVADDVTRTVQERAVATQLVDALEDRIINSYTRLTRDVGQMGRDLNLMKLAQRESDNPAHWMLRAQKLAGGRVVDADLMGRILKAVKEQDWEMAKLQLAKARKASMFDKVGEFWQTSLLASLSRSMRDIVSNTVSTADKAVQMKLATMFDAALGSFTGQRSFGTGSNLMKAMVQGGKRGAEQAWALLSTLRNGGGAVTDAEREALRRAASRYDLLTETSFENPMLRAFAQVIRRTIGAADQPFYEAAFSMSVESQVRAQLRNSGFTGQALEAAVEAMAHRPSPDIISRAVEDALETTWQNSTVLTNAAKFISMRNSKYKSLRLAGKLAAPFAQTPSAMASEGIVRSPIGAGFALADALELGSAVKAADAVGASNAQRKLVKRVAGMSTGAGFIYLGYQMAADGKFTGDYPDDPNERARWEEEGKQPNAVLANGKWVAMSGLLGPQAMLMAIGAQMHDLMKQDVGVLQATTMASATGTGSALMDSPVMQGLSSAVELGQAATEQDPERLESAASRFAESYAGGWVPRIIGQVAAGMDTDESGRTVMRDVGQRGGMLGRAIGSVQSQIPGLREQLPARLTPFGDVRTSGPGMAQVISPLRTTVDRTTPLTEMLGESGYFPRSPRPDAMVGETPEQLMMRRTAEGPQERSLLEGIVQGNPDAWQWVSAQAEQDFSESGDMAALFRSAITAYRSAVTRERRDAAGVNP